MIATTGSQAACDQPSSTRHPVIPQYFEIGAHVVKERRKIATAEEAESLPSERSHARESNRSSTRIANTLHRVGLTTILISITDNINDFIVDSRHLTKHQWLASFDRVAPYALWVGVLFVFAGIVVRDRNSRRIVRLK
jgi:hypothetical protein